MSKWHQLSDELISEILTRLLAKPLARFKCVSKHYNSIIFHPYFLKSYITRSPPSTYVILDRNFQVVNESAQYVTQFNLIDPPKLSTSSMNPHKLIDDPINVQSRPAILHSSNGLLLFTIFFKRVLINSSLPVEEESLFVVNPVINEWAPLPQPHEPMKSQTFAAFTTKLDPKTGLVDKFMVVEYQPIRGSNYANLLCFSSDVGKWVEKSTNYMLGNRLWNAEESFEFEGRLFWVDVSIGLITWDAPGNDPFVGLETGKAAVCRFIPLPSGRDKPTYTPNLMSERYLGSGGGCIHYIEVFNEGNCVLEFWRLKHCEVGEWSLMYKVSRDHVERNLPCGFEKGMPRPCFLHPLEDDVAYFETGNGDYIFSLNVRTCKVVSFNDFKGHTFVLPMVLQKWPSPIPKRLYAVYAKEEGNECFKSRNFTEAITCYSKSIDLLPNAAAFANRAMSYLKVNKFNEAENDCTESLKLDTNYFKVYWRRALARKELGSLEGALEDVEFGLKLEPENVQLKKLCAELKSTLGKESCGGSEYGQKGTACDKDVEAG